MGKVAGVPTKAVAIVLIGVLVASVAIGYIVTQPTLTGGLIMGTTDSVETCLDPARAWDFFGWEIIGALGSNLVEYRAGAATGAVSEIVPALATSWNSSTDGMVWQFNLRTGVEFEDGSEFNATHVKYTIERGININDPDGAFGGLGYSDVIKNVTVASKYVVKFYLKQPFGPFLSFMTMTCNSIVDPKYAPADTVVEYKEGDARGSHPLGLGPYLLASWTRIGGRDTELRLQANPNYWNVSGGYPKNGFIVIKMYADATGLSLAITSGEVDVAFRHLTVQQYDALKSNPSVQVYQGTGAFVQYLCFQERIAPWDNPEIRQALAAAIDRAAICGTVYLGQADPLYSMIPNGMTFHTNAFQTELGYNVSRSLELLGKNGYSSGNKLQVRLYYESSGHYPQSEGLATLLKSQLEATGAMTVTLTGLQWSAYKQARSAHTMDVYIYGWYPDFMDADDYIQPFYDSVGVGWLGTGYDNPQMDTLIAWARYNTSSSVREGLYSQIQDLAVDDCPLVPVYQYSAFAVTKAYVRGVYLDITQTWRLWFLYTT